MDLSYDTGRSGLGGERRLFAARLAVGLIQGLALYALYFAGEHGLWPRTQPAAFGALALAAGYAPVVVLAGAGRLSRRTLTVWTAVAAVVLALMGWHDVDRRVLDSWTQPPFLSFPTLASGAAVLFIAHHLIVPAVRNRRRIAPYADYFDTAWKAGVQLAMSLAFTGAFWLLLHLGGSLFRVIGIDALGRLLGEAWFAIPVLSLAFATAVQLTDVRDGLIRGVRTVALMLLSWLLPVIVVLAAGFLLALPFTGLEGLWGTRRATALVLSAAGTLIVLINTAYQDGRPDNLPPTALCWTVRAGGVLLVPLVGLAFWGLMLRIGQHGLTPDRIIALACALVGAVYAVGYLLAAVRRGEWMQPLERTNLAAAVLSVGLILALFSPLLDPARLAVADQVARLDRGAMKAAAFDYDFLRFDSGRAGRAALDRLARSDDAEVARLAKAAQADRSRYSRIPRPEKVDTEAAANVKIETLPQGAALPDSFKDQFPRLSPVLQGCTGDRACVARALPPAEDGRQRLLVTAPGEAMLFRHDENGEWNEWVKYTDDCNTNLDLIAAAREGRIETRAARFPDLVINGRPLSAQIGVTCPDDR